jgi:pimeloyl-ACP methyl ester carboxylesterase
MILKTARGPIYFEITGDGPPLVFISGWAMTGQCWRPVIETLEASHRCLFYDARGTGRSQPASPESAFELEDHSEDLGCLLDHTGFYDATLIGHDTGSQVAALCALRHPQFARAIVVVSPRPAASGDEVGKLSVMTPTALALRELASYPLLRNLVAWRFRRAPQPFRDRLFEDFAQIDPRAAFQTALSAAAGRSLGSIIDETELSALVLCGDRDREGGREARRIFSGGRDIKLATIKDCGFLPMLEYPRQFARLIRSFSLWLEAAPGGGLKLRR